MGYDPIIAALAVALHIKCPTYVDDLAALLRGPRQAVRAQICLLFAGHAAGLHVAAHTCRCLHIATHEEQLQAHLATLPVTVELTSVGMRVYGLTPELLADIIADAAWTDAPMQTLSLGACRCKLKTAVVPAGGSALWTNAMATAPFGASELQNVWQYLGATVSAPSISQAGRRQAPQSPMALEWTNPHIDAAVHGSWRRALARLAERADALAAGACKLP